MNVDPDAPDFRERVLQEARERRIADEALNRTFWTGGVIAIAVAFFAALLGYLWGWVWIAFLCAVYYKNSRQVSASLLGMSPVRRFLVTHWPFVIPTLIALYALGHPYVDMSSLRDSSP
jgi:biotin transporter BioY